MKLLILYLFFFSLSICTFAQPEDDSEKDHVRVTLADGTCIDGYVQEYWVSGKLFKRFNTSFTLSPKADGKDAVTYNADNVKCIEFVKKTSPDGKYDKLLSKVVANPSILKPKRTRKQFVYEEGGNEIGEIYWWNGIDSQNMQLGKMNITTIYGICLRGDSVIVPFMTGNVISLNAMRIRYKKTNPGLVDYVDKRILKGGKKLWDKLAYSPMIFLEICNEYFARQNNETTNKQRKK